MTEHSEPIVSLEHVYKIFGPDPGGRAYDLSRAGVDKDEVQRLSGHVVGMKDISFTVNKGEIFVVMGLSGSGKSTAIRTVNKLHDITAGQAACFLLPPAPDTKVSLRKLLTLPRFMC